MRRSGWAILLAVRSASVVFSCGQTLFLSSAKIGTATLRKHMFSLPLLFGVRDAQTARLHHGNRRVRRSGPTVQEVLALTVVGLETPYNQRSRAAAWLLTLETGASSDTKRRSFAAIRNRCYRARLLRQWQIGLVRGAPT